MPTPAELYVNGVRKKLRNYFAAWTPGDKLALGDVGTLNGNFFTRVASLNALNIKFSVRSDMDSTPMDYVSESGVSLFFKLAGEANQNLPSIPEANAGFGVKFSGEGAWILEAAESYEPSIENLIEVEAQIRNEVDAGRWDREWAVVVRLITTPVATILISNSTSAKIEFAAEGNLTPANIDIASASVKLSVREQTGDVLKFVRAENLTPLFQLATMKRRLYGTSISIRSMRIADRSESEAKPKPPGRNSSELLYLDLIDELDP